MHRIKALFALRGRASRLEFWRVQLLMSLLSAIVWAGTMFAILAGAPGLFGIVLLAPILAMGVTTGLRRLHDRDKGAGWLALFVVGPFLCFMSAELLLERGTIGILASLLPSLVGLALWGWAWVELGFLRGVPRSNRFGPEPEPFRRR